MMRIQHRYPAIAILLKGSLNDTNALPLKAMLKLSIDLEFLQMAFENASYEQIYYLDKETGEVLIHSSDFPLEVMPDQEEATDEELEMFEKRYLPVPQADSHEGYRDMSAFIETVDDPVLRGKLEVAIEGSGAFRRFKNVLNGEPERERWFAFKEQRLLKRVLEWLESEGIQPMLESETVSMAGL